MSRYWSGVAGVVCGVLMAAITAGQQLASLRTNDPLGVKDLLGVKVTLGVKDRFGVKDSLGVKDPSVINGLLGLKDPFGVKDPLVVKDLLESTDPFVDPITSSMELLETGTTDTAPSTTLDTAGTEFTSHATEPPTTEVPDGNNVDDGYVSNTSPGGLPNASEISTTNVSYIPDTSTSTTPEETTPNRSDEPDAQEESLANEIFTPSTHSQDVREEQTTNVKDAPNTPIPDTTDKPTTIDSSVVSADDHVSPSTLPAMGRSQPSPPPHPHGRVRYQFYLYGLGGELVRRWLSLQQIQDLFLEHHLTDTAVTPDEPTATATPQLVSQESHDGVMKRPALNIEGVVETIQKVMAGEVMNVPITTLGDTSTHPTISAVLLQELIKQQVAEVQENQATIHSLLLDEQLLHLNEVADQYSPTDLHSIIAQEKTDLSYKSSTDKFGAIGYTEVTGNQLFGTPQGQSTDIYSTVRNIPGLTFSHVSLEEGVTKRTGPTYTLTPMTEDDYGSSFSTKPTIQNKPIYNEVTTNLGDYYELNDLTKNNTATTPRGSTSSSSSNFTTAGSSLVSELVGHNSLDSEHYSEFTTYQQVSDTITKSDFNNDTIKNAAIDNHNISKTFTDFNDPQKRPNYFYNYDYYPDLLLTNVLPASQMATDAFKEDMNLDQQDTDEYDYYAQTIYLDRETQDYYEQQPHPSPSLNFSSSAALDFPGPNVAASYHSVEVTDHLSNQPERLTDRINHLPTTVTQAAPNATTTTKQPVDETDFPVENKGNALKEAPPGHLGLEATIQDLSSKIKQFIDVMNNITFQVYESAARQQRSRNFVMAPFNLVSMLSMLLLGARGSTADTLADLLQTDRFRNFNPHLLLKNINQEIVNNNNNSNIAFNTQMFVEKPRRSSIHSLDFYSRTLLYFYGALVEEVEWGSLGNHARERVNEAISNHTRGAVTDFLADGARLDLKPPFSVVSSALMQSQWKTPVTEEDLFDMSFIRFPSAERRLVRTLAIRKSLVLMAGYNREHDVTLAEVALSPPGSKLSMVLVLPGQQQTFQANGLKQMEGRLSPAVWSSLLRSLVTQRVKIQVPYFRHRAYTDLAPLVAGIGLGKLMEKGAADFSGVNGIKSLHLSDVVQLAEFHSCLLPTSTLAYRRAVDLPLHSLWGQDMETASQHHDHTSKENIGDSTISKASGRENINLSSKWAHDESSILDQIWSYFSPDFVNSENDTPSTAFSISAPSSTNIDSHKRPRQQPITSMEIEKHETSDQDINKSSPSKSDLPPSPRRTRGGGPTIAFDRAFLYVIRHNPTGLILYMGRYLGPS